MAGNINRIPGTQTGFPTRGPHIDMACRHAFAFNNSKR
jgi:hypothetical protein